VRYTHGLKTQQERLREAGKLTTSEMVARLELSRSAVSQWARDGRLRAARYGSKPAWLFDPIAQQPEPIQKLAARCARSPVPRATRLDAVPSALRDRIDELLLEGHSDGSIAESLNADGWSTRTGAPYNADAIRRLRRRCGLKTPWVRLRDDGKMSTAQTAVRLGISLKTVGNWVRKGRLRGRLCGKGPRSRMLVDPIDQQPEPIQQLAAARATMPRRRGTLSDAAAGRGAV